MLFNTIQFTVFFIIVYRIYLSLEHKWQNRMLLAASYLFYMSWDWRFISLILISTVIDFVCGILIHRTDHPWKRKYFLFISIFGNLLILGFFKYFNFFASGLETFLSIIGISVHPRILNIVLPVGISFYTFQSMSYTLDIYFRKLEPTKNFTAFALFVSFFPQLVAGPIERANHLLPQILSPRNVTIDKFYAGCYLIFWGLFQKIVVADNLAMIVDPVFSSTEPYNGAKVLIALYAFAFQIFCDFAGYSNIARGLGKCMGFDIVINFNVPYVATNPRAFWQRWNISLSMWLRDYLYIPLGGNRKGRLKTYRNIGITMLLCGLWHGAAWTFVLWGAFHGVILILNSFLRSWLPMKSERVPPFVGHLLKSIRVVFFFHIICLGWLIFRAESIGQAGQMLHALAFNFHFYLTPELQVQIVKILFFNLLIILASIFQLRRNDVLGIYLSRMPWKVGFYLACSIMILVYGVTNGKEFIYFQF